jgi:hypothetical protein
MKRRKVGGPTAKAKTTKDVRVPHPLGNPERFLNMYEKLQEGLLLTNVRDILKEEGVLFSDGSMDYYALYRKWDNVAGRLSQFL